MVGRTAATVTRSSGGEIQPAGLVSVRAPAAGTICQICPGGISARRDPSGSFTTKASVPPTLTPLVPTTRPTLISGLWRAGTGAGGDTAGGNGLGAGGGAS